MLSRRSLFGMFAGGAAAAVAAPAIAHEVITGVDYGKESFTGYAEARIHTTGYVTWSAINDPAHQHFVPQDPGHSHPVFATDMQVIGRPLRGPSRLEQRCNRPVPKNETVAAYQRRLRLPCPGRLE